MRKRRQRGKLEYKLRIGNCSWTTDSFKDFIHTVRVMLWRSIEIKIYRRKR